MAKFSVILPAYNCEKTILNTVNSILTSGIPDLEIIIVDDGSIDETAKICDMLSDKQNCIRCIHQKNAGVSAARNRGIKEATGEYIWFFDADDKVNESAFCRISEIINANEPDMLVFGMEFDYYHKGNIYRRDQMLPHVEGIKSQKECCNILYELYESNSLSSLCNRIIKRSILSQTGIRLREDMFLYEDLEFSLRVLAQCSNVYFVKEPIYKYRQPEDEGSTGRRLNRIAHIPELIEKIEKPITDEPDKNKILLSLYLTLAAEKIKISSKEEIELICSDFRYWVDEQGILSLIENREYAMLVYSGHVSKLITKREYTRIRHSVANWIKQNIGDFRKW